MCGLGGTGGSGSGKRAQPLSITHLATLPYSESPLVPLPQLKCAYQEGGCSIVLFCGSEESRLSALSVALPLLSFRCHACYRAGPSVPLGVLHRVARRSISGVLTECGRRLGFPRPLPLLVRCSDASQFEESGVASQGENSCSGQRERSGSHVCGPSHVCAPGRSVTIVKLCSA